MDTNTLVTAARRKYRFESGRGLVLFEDLFDLSLQTLDKIAVALDQKVQAAGGKSFINKRTVSNTDIINQLELVKFVIETIQADDEAKKVRADKAAEKAFLNSLLEKKKINQLEGLPIEEIEKRLAALDAA